jgi:predicted membrane protein
MRFWLLVSVALTAFAALLYFTATMAHDHNVTFDTYMSVVLSALAIMLTALAIIVGIAAIWGYQQISERAEQRAQEAVESKVASTTFRSRNKSKNPHVHRC